jgi:hypothetical protein
LAEPEKYESELTACEKIVNLVYSERLNSRKAGMLGSWEAKG